MNLIEAVFPQPSLLELQVRHPQLALAIASGIVVRPDVRPLSVQLQNSQLGNPQPTSFAQPISNYSVFTGAVVTIDPTNDANGNPIKYISDAAQALVTGVTLTLQVQARSGINYSPAPEETPLQGIPRLFAPLAWSWTMKNPENVKAIFTVQTQLNGSPFTAWLLMGFAVVGSEGDGIMDLKGDDARALLVQTAAYKLALGQPLT